MKDQREPLVLSDAGRLGPAGQNAIPTPVAGWLPDHRRQRFPPVLLLISLAALATMACATAQVPNALLHSLFDPSPAPQAFAAQGASVAVDGGLTVVGSPDDDIGELDSGVVRVYDTDTGTLLHLLHNPTPLAFDNFGFSVAVSGTRVVVGTREARRAYVYDLASATPAVPVATLTGSSVAISGTRVAVGVYGNFIAGSAYVYDLASASPTVAVVTLTNPSPAEGDLFGGSVAISGARAVIGAIGRAYVYDLASANPTVPVTTLTNPSPAEFHFFGSSVAISGTRVAVGAYEFDLVASDTGSAYVYDLTSATPTVPVVTLTSPSPAESEFFGASVALSGTRVVVGAERDNTGATWAGSAHVYDLANSNPTVPVVTLTNPSPARAEGDRFGDRFGSSVAVSGTRVVIGAPGDDTAAFDAGGAYVYDLANPNPTVPVATLNNSSPAAQDRFGWSVAVSGTRVVAGAPVVVPIDFDVPSAFDVGSAYVYDLASATPAVPVTTLTNPSPAAFDAFGVSVAISGTRVVVGASRHDMIQFNVGSAYVYDLTSASPTVPVLTLTNPNPTFDARFGGSVAVSGMHVVVGAELNETGHPFLTGSAYVYDLASATPAVPVATLTGSWVAISGTRVLVGVYNGLNAGSAHVYDLASASPTVPVATLTNAGPSFGRSVAISGARAVIGAIGRAYVYDLASANPTVPVTTLTNPNPVALDLDYFGSSVAISGTRVAVGAYGDDTGASNAGSAYVYDLTSANPTVPVAMLTNPSPAPNDRFGSSVAVDGTTVATGAPFVNTTTADRGAAYIFGLGPTLRIVPAAPGGLATISWTPATSCEFVLQYADSLAPSNWVNAPSGAANPVTVPATASSRFYRLFKP